MAGKKNKEKAFASMLKAYSKLRLLSTMYNEILGQTFLSRFKYASGMCCVSMSFVFVKMVSSGDFFVIGLSGGSMITIVTIFFLMAQYCSKVHADSCELRKYLMSQKLPGKLALGKEMRSYKVIGVKIGSFYVIRRGTPLTLLAMVSNTTMSLLMSINFAIWNVVYHNIVLQ